MAGSDTVLPQISCDSIDDYLGPRERRFFGEGFKRAVHHLADVRVATAADGTGVVSATVAVDYPADWSRKGEQDQRAHLSTVDIMVLGARLVEVHLRYARGLDREQLRAAALERVRIKAGSAPVEDGLTGFPARARITGSAPAPDGSVTTVAECVIGTMRLHCELRHAAGTPAPDPNATPAGFTDAELRELLDEGPHVYAEEYTLRRQYAENVTAVPSESRADARVRIDPALPELPASALVVDAFVIGLQLGQLLLYELDGISRADSNTLWMRLTEIECRDNGVPRVPVAPVTVRLDNRRLIEKAGHEVWRAADIVCAFQRIDMRCSVAHRVK